MPLRLEPFRCLNNGYEICIKKKKKTDKRSTMKVNLSGSKLAINSFSIELQINQFSAKIKIRRFINKNYYLLILT